MPILLNKIDPVIVNNVQQQTADGIIHSSDRTRVSKDSKKENGGYSSNKKIKEKLAKFNSLLSIMELNITFNLDNDIITALDKDGNIVRKYTKDELTELFNKMGDMLGIFIDTRK